MCRSANATAPLRAVTLARLVCTGYIRLLLPRSSIRAIGLVGMLATALVVISISSFFRLREEEPYRLESWPKGTPVVSKTVFGP